MTDTGREITDDELNEWVDWFLNRQRHPHTKRLVALTSAIRRVLKCAGLRVPDEHIENEIRCLLEPEDDINW